MVEPMTAWELAHKLLDLPDDPILIDGIGFDLKIVGIYSGRLNKPEIGQFSIPVVVIEVNRE